MLSLRMPLKPRGAHLNGNITIDFSTLAGSLLTGNNGAGSNGDAEDTAVYSVAWGSKGGCLSRPKSKALGSTSLCRRQRIAPPWTWWT